MRRPVSTYTTPAMGRWLAWRASGKGHQGWDYYAPRGTPVLAAMGGRVISVSYSGPNTNRSSWSAQMGFGHNFTVSSGDIKATHAHMNQAPSIYRGGEWRAMRVGDTITEGEQVGFVGDSGNAWAVGTHLHLQVTRGGVTINPESLMPALSSSSGTHLSALVNLTKAQITKLQTDFDRLGYDIDIDGVYGNGTKGVVSTFQRQHNLLVDGLAGVNTLKALAVEIAELDAAEEAKRQAAEVARLAAEAAAKRVRETPIIMDLFWDNETNQSGYLGTPLGIVGLHSREVFELFERRITAYREGRQETFNKLQIQMMNNVLAEIREQAGL